MSGIYKNIAVDYQWLVDDAQLQAGPMVLYLLCKLWEIDKVNKLNSEPYRTWRDCRHFVKKYGDLVQEQLDYEKENEVK